MLFAGLSNWHKNGRNDIIDMYDTYKDGVKSSDGSRDIISVNPNAAAYYLYLANNVANDSNSKESQTAKKEIIKEFESQKEDTCYRYFEFLKEKYNIDGFERNW